MVTEISLPGVGVECALDSGARFAGSAGFEFRLVDGRSATAPCAAEATGGPDGRE